MQFDGRYICCRSGVELLSQLPSVPLFCQSFRVIEILVTYGISRLYLVDVTAAMPFFFKQPKISIEFELIYINEVTLIIRNHCVIRDSF